MPRGRHFQFTIFTVRDGFFDGFNRPVTVSAILAINTLIAWILFSPEQSTETLRAIKTVLLEGVRGWFFYCLAGLLITALIIAALPISARLRLAKHGGARPEFSTFSWLSMMFCGGIGAGIVVYGVAEPMSHFTTNPELLQGQVSEGSVAAARSALKYTFLHWGLSAWACYTVLGLALALFSYRYGLPLTIRSVVAPLFKHRLAGACGHVIDVFAIVAILAGLATTLGYSMHSISAGLGYLMDMPLAMDTAEPRLVPLIALVACACLAARAVISGVDHGIKWLSIVGTLAFFAVLAFFALHTPPNALREIALAATFDYIADLPSLSLNIFSAGHDVDTAALSTWQADWTVFYWTWWIAFAPFVSLFLARISKGRTVREFVLGSALAPCGLCFAWFACSGTAALSLEMSQPEPLLANRVPSEQLFVAIAELDPTLSGQIICWIAFTVVFILAAVTFASGLMAITTIAAAGDNAAKPRKHTRLWAVLATGIIGALFAAGGTASIRDVMVICALPISLVISGAALSVIWALSAEIRHMRANSINAKPIFATRRTPPQIRTGTDAL
ncbi:BCCT family transporter [Primorskyibacter sp. S187A]|uniref:BCCT family transporter n=1 Tax=Primorskyibacter sp. S187A TaxID=3415130 RepID=UPI003C7DA00D